MSGFDDKALIESLTRHGDTRRKATMKLKKILKKANALDDVRAVRTLFETQGNNADDLIRQIATKIDESRARIQSSKRKRSPTLNSDIDTDTDIEEWSKLPGATLKKPKSMNSKMFEKGGKSRKNRKSRKTQRR
jgi:hypothetical protein